jgi:hypothetical protein
VEVCFAAGEQVLRGPNGFGGQDNIRLETISVEERCQFQVPTGCARPQPYRDPIAQTFYVEGMPFGCYVTNLDLYFRTKSSTAPITLQLREVVNGYPGNKVIPFGEVTLNPADISVSENATAATNFVFPSPVYLQNNTEYCFVLLPAGNNPDYNIWVSELGANELGTENRISEQPHVGLLFTSANDRSWTAWQAEDIKFTLRRADFDINTVGSIEMKNMDVDFLKFDSFTNGNFEPGDAIHGFSFGITNAGSGYGSALAATVAVSGTAGQFTCGASKLVVGDLVTITGTLGGTATITGYSTGTVYKVSAVTGSVGAVTGFTLTTQDDVAIATTAGTLTGLTYTVATVVQHTLSGGGATTNATVNVTITGGVVTNVAVTNPGAGYTSNPTLTVSSGGGSGAVVAVTLNRGFVKQYDSLYNVGKILVRGGRFTATDIIGNGTTFAEITEVENKQLNVVETNIGFIDHTPAVVSWSIAPTATGATAAGDSYEGINFGQEHALTYEAQVYSYSNEQANLGGDKSLSIRAGMVTQTSTVSPVIDTRKCSMIAIANDINGPDDISGEDGNNGTAASKYISRRVILDDGQDAEDLRVYLSNQIPAGCDVRVYGRFQNATDPSNFDDLEWIQLELAQAPIVSTGKSGFVEYQYTIPTANKNAGVLEYTAGSVTYSGYKNFAVKVIPTSTNSSVVPLVRELRAIALQV